MNLWKLSRFNF